MRMWIKKIKDLLNIEKNVFHRVVYAQELPLCPDCLEPWCPTCKAHYAECECIGPHEDPEEVEYLEWQGNLYGRRKINGE